MSKKLEKTVNEILKNKNLKRLIEVALDEDLPAGDCTSMSTLKKNKKVRAEFIAKDNGVVGGLFLVPFIIKIAKEKKIIEGNIKFKSNVKEGTIVSEDKVLGEIEGGIRDILALERLLLNCLSRVSGIATYTNLLVKILNKNHAKAKIFDTRKTIPGWRQLDKYGVACGGGENHRMDLSEYLLIKDNHWCGDYDGVLEFLRNRKKMKKLVEVEVDNFELLYRPEILNADIIMLDNFDYNNLQKGIKYIREEQKKLKRKIIIEISGKVDEAKLKKLAKLNVDRISIGAITHSVKCFDISLSMEY